MSDHRATRGSIAVVTVVARNFLAAGHVLAESFRAWHPDIPLYVVLADGPAPGFEPVMPPEALLSLETLGIPDLRYQYFASNRRQLAILAKVHALRGLLDRGYDTVVFLDADILILGSLDPLFAVAATHAVTLTPHLLFPPEGADRRHRELHILRSGVYNGGCVGATRCDESLGFLEWWAARLASQCVSNPDGGLHYDQRWLDFAPSFLGRLGIARSPGLNVAYWNQPERRLRREGRLWRVDGDVGRFFHFSGFDPLHLDEVTQHRPGITRAQLGGAAELFDDYSARLLGAGYVETHALPYAHGCFDNGVAIPEEARGLYRRTAQLHERFGDPFVTRGDSFYRWLTEADASRDRLSRVPRLWAAIYESRADLQRAFPDPDGIDRDAFRHWTQACGLREHAVDPALAPASPHGPAPDG